MPGDHKGSGNGWINVSARRASQHKDGRGDGSAKGQLNHRIGSPERHASSTNGYHPSRTNQLGAVGAQPFVHAQPSGLPLHGAADAFGPLHRRLIAAQHGVKGSAEVFHGHLPWVLWLVVHASAIDYHVGRV